MNVRLFGYCRVSSCRQNLDRQIIAMRQFGVPDENLVVEMMTGKNFQRPAYQDMVAKLKHGDVLVLNSLDRLGRDYSSVVDAWRYITNEIGADIVILDMELLDTRKKGRDFTASFVADLVLQILSYVAETELRTLHARQEAGIAAAKARGVKFGKAPMSRPKMFHELCEQWKRGEISSREAGRKLGVSHTTFMTWIREESTEE
ncbi:MAG: recombinase family protein [Defluviitaleaceae bacterium]|nr:recombinase family protein [Defluviitaleaceae bacterium]